MYKVLIVDDEPLVQVGISSMINWGELNMEICGTAVNGQVALNLIKEHSPDIVITDIKMPVMSGLELIRLCRESYGNSRPYFIILTSYEDFHMVKEALTYQVSDYLVKLELTPESLREAVLRVMGKIHQAESKAASSGTSVHPFYDKFFISLLHNLFTSEEQFELQRHDLNLDFHYEAYVCCYGEFVSRLADSLPADRQLSLFASSLQMMRELAGKYMPCYALSLDIRHFALIFCYERRPSGEAYEEKLTGILRSISVTLQKYYNVYLYCGIGSLVSSPQGICDSYQYSRQAYLAVNDDFPLAFFEDSFGGEGSHNSSFNISLFKNDLTRAFEEYDSEILRSTVTAICQLFEEHHTHNLQALDAACNILYLSISLLQDGEATVSGFFSDIPDGYRSIYKQSSVEQIVSWLRFLTDKLCLLFEHRRKDYKNHIVTNVRKYINEHLQERLSLNEVAAGFGISPSYLSQLFGKYNDTGFNEYVNLCKINESKRLLTEENLKVYEVAQRLGFESAFYFSKVFKKVVGVSPTEFLNS